MGRTDLRRCLPLLAVCLLGPGCAVQHYTAHDLDPAALTASFEARALDAPGLVRFIAARRPGTPWPPRHWDFSLLMLAALYYSPDLDTARRQWASAQAAVVTAGQRPNPVLQLPLEYGANPRPEDSHWTFGIGLDIPIETAGKRGYRVDRATRLSEAARASIAQTVWQVRSRLRGQLLELSAADRRAALLAAQVGTQEQVVAMLQKRVTLGAASAGELGLQRVALIRARADESRERGRRAEARAAIAGTLGLPAAALDAVTLDETLLDQPLADVPERAARRLALANRADFRAALQRYAAAQAALQLELANQYPDIHLGPAYTFDQGVNKFAFGVPGIVLPILNRNEGPIAEAEARRREAEAEVVQVQARALDDAARALAAYGAARTGLSQSRALADDEARTWTREQRQFDAGQSDRLSLALARQAERAAQLARLDAAWRAQTAAGRLEDALQRPLPPSPSDVNLAWGPVDHDPQH